MKSSAQHQFAVVPSVSIQRSRFNRSFGLKTTFDAGYLVPVFCDEVLPGDTFNLRMTHFARLATPLKPIMDNLYLDSFFFFCPNRLVWTNFVKMMGEQDAPDDTVDYTVPQMAAPAGGYLEHSLHDYFGIPTKITGLKHSALPFRMYNLIWNTWFRPQDVCDPYTVDKDDADSDPADYNLLKRAKRHDYFTSSLPFPQKGDDVLLPLGDKAPVTGIGGTSTYYAGSPTNINIADGSSPSFLHWKNSTDSDNNMRIYLQENPDLPGYPNVFADLSQATAATINSLREAFGLQRMLERDARSGTRYVEALRARFGVVSPDFRLQRPEYLGGGSSRVNVTPVAQQSASGATGTTTKMGDLAGMATCAGQHGFSKSFTEHGFVIGLVCLRADLTYYQGLPRMWSRLTRFDHYEPVLANLGEQAVKNKEIYAQGPAVLHGSTPYDEETFGYQERWAEYRYKPSQLTGLFRPNATGTLDIWHAAQIFATLPSLDTNFILENPPLDRCIAVPSEPHMIFDSMFDFTCVRPMPVYSVPGLIDHH